MVMDNSGIVYIVHHVDTEGPLNEPISELFDRIEHTLGFDLNLQPSRENLQRLLGGSIKTIDKDIIKGIGEIISPHMINFNTSWYEVDKMLKKILSNDFRNTILDSYGNGWIFNWHIMDHVGFITNERRRDLGYLNIFNHYEEILKNTNSNRDGIHWHFHPIPFFREAHIAANSYENSFYELHQILCRRLIEKSWFPRVNRAGFHTIRPDSNWFLEQWIPFDASNQSKKEPLGYQRDAKTGRFGDWKNAPDDWSIYHPDLYDWRKVGNANRFISRALNLKLWYRAINEGEIEKAFNKAQIDGRCYLGISNHDFRDMSIEIDEFREMLLRVSKKYPDIAYKFSEAIDAFRNVLGYNPKEVESDKIEFDVNIKDNVLKVRITNGSPFGPQPYLAIKSISGQYFHDNFDFGDYKRDYYYTFDRVTIEPEKVKKIGIASNDKYGNSFIEIKDLN